MPYRLSALAEQDLDEIWSYVAENASPTTADRPIDAIVDRFELLAELIAVVLDGMDLTDVQWAVLEPTFRPRRRPDGRGRPWTDPRAAPAR
jgi:ParE toxin of type II toxin-antitoxin system, parDE